MSIQSTLTSSGTAVLAMMVLVMAIANDRTTKLLNCITIVWFIIVYMQMYMYAVYSSLSEHASAIT